MRREYEKKLRRWGNLAAAGSREIDSESWIKGAVSGVALWHCVALGLALWHSGTVWHWALWQAPPVAEILVSSRFSLGCYKIANSALSRVFSPLRATISSADRALHFLTTVTLGPASRLIMGNHRPLEETKKLRPTITAGETLRCSLSGWRDWNAVNFTNFHHDCTIRWKNDFWSHVKLSVTSHLKN